MIFDVAGMVNGGVAGHFGREMKRERMAHGWSIAELARRMGGVDPAHLGRVENGRRPPTEAIADGLDRVFPERRGWFSTWHQESQMWPEVPATFRSWPDYEDRAARLQVWQPSIVTGLLQIEDYARALICVQPDATDSIVSARLTSRMERQARLFTREPPPSAWFVVDELALYRCVGSAEIMTAQLRHLTEAAALPKLTVQVLPAIAHPANASGFLVADDAMWCEHVAGGYVFTEAETISAASTRFDSLRGECYRVSESLALIERLARQWATGVSPLTRMATEGTA